MTEREILKAKLRDQISCNTCKYGVIGSHAHCTFGGGTVLMEKLIPGSQNDVGCSEWEPQEIDDKTREEFEKAKRSLYKDY